MFFKKLHFNKLIKISIDNIEINEIENKFLERKGKKVVTIKKLFWKYGSLGNILKIKKLKDSHVENTKLYEKLISTAMKKGLSVSPNCKKKLEKFSFL